MSALFVFWIAAFPFVLVYGAYEGPKVWWLWVGGFFLSLFWLFRTKPPLANWFLLWIFVLCIASIVGVHPADSIVGGGYRHQGVLYFFTMYLIGQTIQLLSKQAQLSLIYLLRLGVIAESCVVILQKIFDWGSRPLGTFGEPNATAGFLAIGLYWLVQTNRWSWAVVVCLAIVATGSRGGILAACIILSSRIISKKVIVLIIGIIAVMFIGISRPSSVYENRPLFWRYATNAITARPLLGYGAESSELLFEQMFLKDHVRLIDLTVDRSHNIFLDILMWSGIAGFVVFLLWLRDLFKISSIRWPLIAWIVFASLQPVGVVHWVQLMLLWAITAKSTQEKEVSSQGFLRGKNI